MAKLADAQDLGSCPVRGGGSTPSSRIVLIIFALLFIFPRFVFSIEPVSTELHNASPVFEELLANQIVSVRNKLIQNKVISATNRFFLISENKTGKQVAVSLKKIDPSVNWDSLLFLTEDAKALPELVGDKDIVIAFGTKSVTDELKPDFQKSDLDAGISFTVPELEYVKDEKGRQIVNLGRPQYEQAIFERLVREGMNPVLAAPAANESLLRLRTLNDTQILFFFKKNLLNLLKNLDFS